MREQEEEAQRGMLSQILEPAARERRKSMKGIMLLVPLNLDLRLKN